MVRSYVFQVHGKCLSRAIFFSIYECGSMAGCFYMALNGLFFQHTELEDTQGPNLYQQGKTKGFFVHSWQTGGIAIFRGVRSRGVAPNFLKDISHS